MVFGPLARHPKTGRFVNMIQEKYEATVYHTSKKHACYNCIHNPGEAICKSSCSFWLILKLLKRKGLLKTSTKEKTRWVFPDGGVEE